MLHSSAHPSLPRLGKLAPRHDPRTLLFEKYVEPKALPPAPKTETWAHAVSSWPMMQNDTIGDCTCAAAGHMIQCWTANVGNVIVPSNASIIAAYAAITGYNPTTGANDNG